MVALLLAMSLAACATPKLSLAGIGIGSSAKPEPVKPQEPAATPDPLADVETTIRQAQALRKSGDFQAAARNLSQLVLFVPDNPRLLGEYGKVLVAQGRSEDALAFLERAVQLQPGDWSLYSAQGIAYDAQGRYQAAQNAYARALVLNPGEPVVLNNAALSHMQSGDLAAAEKLLLQVGATAPDYPRVAQNLMLLQSLKASRATAPVMAAPATPPEPVVPAQVAITPAVAAPAPPAPVVQKAQVPNPPAPMPATKPPAMRNLAAAKVVPFAKIASPAAARASFKSAYYVQAGAYGTPERATRIARDLDSLGARVSPTTVDGHAIYRVRIGPFRDAEQAGTAVAQAKLMGHADLKIVPE